MKKSSDRITCKTTTQVLSRSKGSCEVKGCTECSTSSPHHVFFKSQYFGSDRNLAWNLCDICTYHHRIIHAGSTEAELRLKVRIDYELKKEAVGRYHGNNVNKLAGVFRVVKYKHDKSYTKIAEKTTGSRVSLLHS